MRLTIPMLAATVAVTAGNAFGAYTITQTATQGPVYAGHSVQFEDAAIPTGVALPNPWEFYQASDGISFTSGNGLLAVADWDLLEGIAGGNGDGNQLAGGFNLRMLFDDDITEISFQGWTDGNPGPPTGGVNVALYNDGAQVAIYSGISPFGGVGDEWFNAVGDGGDSFDEVRFYNTSANFSFIDNVSWNVPTPGALAMLAVAGLCGRRRRRA